MEVVDAVFSSAGDLVVESPAFSAQEVVHYIHSNHILETLQVTNDQGTMGLGNFIRSALLTTFCALYIPKGKHRRHTGGIC